MFPNICVPSTVLLCVDACVSQHVEARKKAMGIQDTCFLLPGYLIYKKIDDDNDIRSLKDSSLFRTPSILKMAGNTVQMKRLQ